MGFDVEHWRPVPIREYSDAYSVSSLGRVRRETRASATYPGFILKNRSHTKGYHVVQLSLNGKSKTVTVHRLVCEAFLGIRPDGAVIDHISGVKVDNRLSNLEYVSSLENSRRARVLGLVDMRGERNHRSKLTSGDVLQIRSLREDKGLTLSEIACLYGVGTTCVSRIVNRETWKHL